MIASELSQRSDWIATYSGGTFFPLAPRIADVRIADIAHALSMLCRFAGHTRAFYSVAQHSVLVSHLCGQQDALWGLLHDASEAYLSDIVSPLKRASGMGGYRVIEQRVQMVIAQAFNLPLVEPCSVKAADQALLRIEQRDLVTMPAGWDVRVPAHHRRIEPWTPQEAEAQFLARFLELTR